MSKIVALVWGLAVAAVVGISLWIYQIAPDRVPTHRGTSLAADAWGSPLESLLSTGGVGLAVLVFMPALFWLLSLKPKALNLPSQEAKEYWTRPENLPQFQRFVREWGVWFAISLAAFLLSLSVLEALVWRFADTPPMPWLFFVFLGAFLAVTALLTVWFMRATKVPSTSTQAPQGPRRT